MKFCGKEWKLPQMHPDAEILHKGGCDLAISDVLKAFKGQI